MSIQAFATDFLNAQTQAFIDPKSGLLTTNGKYFLLALFNRTGQGTGIIPAVSAPLVATGSTIADALGLGADWNLIGTVAANTGVQIPALKPGNDIEVFNMGANALKIYPPSAAIEIDALGNGAPYVLNPGKLRILQCWTLSQFISLGN